MRFEKQKKSICFLLMMCMLFLGMCVENIQADSFFSYESTNHTVSTILSAERTSLTSQVYPVETLSTQDYAICFRQIVRRTLTKGTRGTTLDLILVDILPQISPIILTSSDCELTKDSSSSTVIVTYIHQKDGKKA